MYSLRSIDSQTSSEIFKKLYNGFSEHKLKLEKHIGARIDSIVNMKTFFAHFYKSEKYSSPRYFDYMLISYREQFKSKNILFQLYIGYYKMLLKL